MRTDLDALLPVDVKKLGNISDGGGWRYVGREQGHKNRAPTAGKPRSKHHGPLLGTAFVHTVLDDHSRVACAKIHDDETAHSIVAALRGEANRNPDRGLTDLIGELVTHSDAFRTLWAAHDVRLHRTGSKHIHHPVVGDTTLVYEVMALTADDGLVLNAFTAEPGSPSADALNFLVSRAASSTEGIGTSDQAGRTPAS